VILVT